MKHIFYFILLLFMGVPVFIFTLFLPKRTKFIEWWKPLYQVDTTPR